MGLIIAFGQSDFWRVRNIVCQAVEEDCPSQIWQTAVDLTFNKNIIFLPTQKISEEILRKNPILKEIKIKKKLPAKLILEIKKRQALVVLSSEPSGEDFYVIDEEGVVLAKEKKTDLPLIFFSPIGKWEIGQRVEEEKIQQTVDILTKLRLNLFKPKSAKIISPYSLEVWLNEGFLVVFSLKKEGENQVGSLQTIFSRSKIEGRVIKKIDLRFDKPVVNYE